MRKTIKQQILDHMNAGYTLTYGQANTITNSQSGYRRMQEILKENPDKYRFIKVKSKNGGYYNIFGLPKSFQVLKTFYRIGCKKMWFVSSDKSNIVPNYTQFYKTKKEAQAQIKKVIR